MLVRIFFTDRKIFAQGLQRKRVFARKGAKAQRKSSLRLSAFACLTFNYTLFLCKPCAKTLFRTQILHRVCYCRFYSFKTHRY